MYNNCTCDYMIDMISKINHIWIIIPMRPESALVDRLITIYTISHKFINWKYSVTLLNYFKPYNELLSAFCL